MLFGVMSFSNVWSEEVVDVSEIMLLLKQLQEQLSTQQQEISDLKKQLYQQDDDVTVALDHERSNIIAPMRESEDLIESELREAQDSRYAAIKEVPGITLGKGISGLSLKGDARFRYERQERKLRNAREQTRDRQRIRLRFGAIWEHPEDGWKVGVGISTGGNDATSTNQTFSDGQVFESGDIRLDYAYAQHQWQGERYALAAIIGQQKNPWKDSTTYMLWDSDVRPIGITGRFSWEGLFVTTGIYDVFHFGRDQANSVLLAGQLGYQGELEDFKFTIATGYWHFNNPTGDIVPVDRRYDYSIGDVFGKIKSNIGDFKIQAHGHVASNFGADGPIGTGQQGGLLEPEEEDLAWLIGTKVSYDSFELGLDYAHIEADSVFAELKDSDFGDTAGLTDTNVKGIKLKAKYKFSKSLSLSYAYFDLSEVEGPSRSGDLHQLDLRYKF